MNLEDALHDAAQQAVAVGGKPDVVMFHPDDAGGILGPAQAHTLVTKGRVEGPGWFAEFRGDRDGTWVHLEREPCQD